MPERTTLEAFGGIIIAVVLALVSMPWWGVAALLLALVTIVLDLSFHSPLTARFEHRSKIIVCVVAEALILVPGVRTVANQYHVEASHEDLRASFFIEMRGVSSFNVEYAFVNQGSGPATVISIALTGILANNRVDEPSANASLCQNAHAVTLLLTQAADRLGLSEVANQNVTSESYSPKDVQVDGAPWPRGAPIEIAGGRGRSVTATYDIDAGEQAKYNVMALCPTVEARDDIGLGGTAVCRGMVSVRTDVGLVAIRSAQRVRILPRTRDLLCPPAE
jgi:hypothetical protein